MTRDEAATFTNPDFHTPRTFGILNIVFSLLLLPCSMCMSLYAIIPAAIGFASEAQVTRLTQQEAEREAQRRQYEGELKAVQSDERKEMILAKIRDLETLPRSGPNFPNVLLDPLFRDPAYLGYFIADLSTGIALNLAMLVSGAGLIYFKGWSRLLAVGVSWLKVIRLLGLAVAATFLFAPWVSRILGLLEQEALKLDPSLAVGNPHSGPRAAMIVRIIAWIIFVFGTIYPIAQIRFLGLPSVREAFRNRVSR